MGRNIGRIASKLIKASQAEQTAPVITTDAQSEDTVLETAVNTTTVETTDEQSKTDAVLEESVKQTLAEQENTIITPEMVAEKLCSHEKTNVEATLDHGKILYRAMVQQISAAAQNSFLEDASLRCKRNGYKIGERALKSFAVLYWLSVEFKSLKYAPSVDALTRFAGLAKVKDGSFMLDVHTDTDRKAIDDFIHEACSRIGQFEIALTGTTNRDAVDSGDYLKKITRFVARLKGNFGDYGRNEAEYKEIQEKNERAKEEKKAKEALAQTQAEELCKNPSLFIRDVCLASIPKMNLEHLEYLRNTLNVLIESRKPANPENSI